MKFIQNMKQLKIVIFVIITTYDMEDSNCSQFAGPFDIVFQQIAKCSEEGTGEISFDQTKINKYNRTTYLYSSNFSMPYGFTDDIKITLTVYIWGNGGWKLQAANMNFGPACSGMKKLSPKFVEGVSKAMGLWPRLCPSPPGNYTLKDFPLEMEVKMPVLPYNKYQLEVGLIRRGIKIGCGRMYVDIVPKKKH